MSGLRYRAEQVDRRFNDWHYSLPRSYSYIDLDGLLVCGRCWSTLALVEVTSNPEKPTVIMRKLARAAGKPCYLVQVPPPFPSGPFQFDHQTEIRWRQLEPAQQPWIVDSLYGWYGEEAQVRDDHRCGAP